MTTDLLYVCIFLCCFVLCRYRPIDLYTTTKEFYQLCEGFEGYAHPEVIYKNRSEFKEPKEEEQEEEHDNCDDEDNDGDYGDSDGGGGDDDDKQSTEILYS
jgi:hypothetical protein